MAKVAKVEDDEQMPEKESFDYEGAGGDGALRRRFGQTFERQYYEVGGDGLPCAKEVPWMSQNAMEE